jgi:acyl transferase domain-containing protein
MSFLFIPLRKLDFNTKDQLILLSVHFCFEMKKFAIIGIGSRFPNSKNTDEFFENLLNKEDCLREIPEERWNKDYYNSETKVPGKISSNKGGFIDKVFEFDNESFSMNTKEASNIDPQQKILLEVTLDALEDSNIKYRGSKTGVFIGTGQTDYSDFSLSKDEYINEYTASGSALSIHSNILSYKFDLRGPSLRYYNIVLTLVLIQLVHQVDMQCIWPQEVWSMGIVNKR